MPEHWQDHRSQGRAVLPAVEAMQLMAHWVRERHPSVDVRTISQAGFEKFLPLPESGPVTAFCRTTGMGTTRLRAAMETRVSTRTGKMTRTLVHAQAIFGPSAADPVETAVPWSTAAADMTVDPHRIYEELVPFGPAYRNIAEPLCLYQGGAVAHIVAPDFSDRQTGHPLGSPFVLDAAFHAACVWGQRYAGVVAFPVGIEGRTVHRPTSAGVEYIARATAVKRDASALIFDLSITSMDGSSVETLSGVTMRDVSRGRLQPPDWILK